MEVILIKSITHKEDFFAYHRITDQTQVLKFCPSELAKTAQLTTADDQDRLFPNSLEWEVHCTTTGKC